MRLLVVGASTRGVCGVRDCASVLAPALERAGASVQTAWWNRDAGGTRRNWLDRARILGDGVDAVVWHYSVFAYGSRGVPWDVPLIAEALRRVPGPLVVFAHELVYPWGRRGARGGAQAAAQHLVLPVVVRAAAVVVVTTEERQRWVASQRWLPRRPVRFAPVPSNVAPTAGGAPANGTFRVGVFGFTSDGLAADSVARAVASVEIPARLELVGAPGPDSPQADTWRAAGARAGVRDLSFTGVLPAAELAHAVASLDVVVFPDPAGPTSRRGTLAAALAHARPVLAIDGPQTWRRAVDEGAVVVSPEAGLGHELRRLAGDDDARAEQGRRGREFYERRMSDDVVAATVLDAIREVTT